VKQSILHSFVVLEGLDGSGTTTQMRLLAERLSREGTAHSTTWEPTKGPIGLLLRSILARETRAHPRTIALLYAADRNDHVHDPESGIEARVRRGELVVCDRYLFSSLAYQSIECGFDYVMGLNADFPLPQCVIFVDTPVEICQERLSARGKPELYDGMAFQRRVREGYLEIFRRFEGASGMRIAQVAGDRPAGLVHGEIWKILEGLPINGM
jgi:dTMP kinase